MRCWPVTGCGGCCKHSRPASKACSCLMVLCVSLGRYFRFPVSIACTVRGNLFIFIYR